jgi:hypothetical protein
VEEKLFWRIFRLVIRSFFHRHDSKRVDNQASASAPAGTIDLIIFDGVFDR